MLSLLVPFTTNNQLLTIAIDNTLAKLPISSFISLYSRAIPLHRVTILSETYLAVTIFKDIIDGATAHLDTSQKEAVRLVLEFAQPLVCIQEPPEAEKSTLATAIAQIA